MTKNPIKFVRNPNSPEAIQSRLDGYADTTAFESTHYIFDSKENHIIIDLTEDHTPQRVNHTLMGGNKAHMNKRLVRTSTHTDDQGRVILTNYYTDVRNQQWVVIKSFLGKELPKDLRGSYATSARGETWRNEGKSVDKLREAQKRLRNSIDIDPDADLDKESPNDHFHDDFTGQK